MSLASRPPTAPASRRTPLIVLAALVVTLVVLGWASAAAAQEDPPPTDPPSTTPPTDPPPTDPPPTSPPPTDPPPTDPPVTSGPPAPTPVTTAPPTATAPGGAAPAPPTTVRRNTATTQRRGTPDEPVATESEGPTPASEVAEDDPAVAPVPQPVATGERQPLLVAPTTVPGSPAVALVDAAPAASSKALPLAIIVALGLGGLALVLRPGRSAATPDPEAASPVLLAGPSVVVPRRRPGVLPSPVVAEAPSPPIGPTVPADTLVPGGEPGADAPGTDLPAVADLVAEARRGRGGAAPPDPR